MVCKLYIDGYENKYPCFTQDFSHVLMKSLKIYLEIECLDKLDHIMSSFYKLLINNEDECSVLHNDTILFFEDAFRAHGLYGIIVYFKDKSHSNHICPEDSKQIYKSFQKLYMHVRNNCSKEMYEEFMDNYNLFKYSYKHSKEIRLL